MNSEVVINLTNFSSLLVKGKNPHVIDHPFFDFMIPDFQDFIPTNNYYSVKNKTMLKRMCYSSIDKKEKDVWLWSCCGSTCPDFHVHEKELLFLQDVSLKKKAE